MVSNSLKSSCQTWFGLVGVAGITVRRIAGTAQFPSIDAWIHTDIRGWTLADTLTERQYQTLLNSARDRLARFTRPDGTVSFPAPALIATATPNRR